MRKIFMLLALCTVLALSACGKKVFTNDISTYLTTKTPINVVEESIILAGTQLGWKVNKESNGVMDAYLFLRGHEVNVKIEYTSKSYVIKYVDSKNMNYNPSKGTIHAKYRQWVNNLDREIRKNIIIYSK